MSPSFKDRSISWIYPQAAASIIAGCEHVAMKETTAFFEKFLGGRPMPKTSILKRENKIGGIVERVLTEALSQSSAEEAKKFISSITHESRWISAKELDPSNPLHTFLKDDDRDVMTEAYDALQRRTSLFETMVDAAAMTGLDAKATLTAPKDRITPSP